MKYPSSLQIKEGSITYPNIGQKLLAWNRWIPRISPGGEYEAAAKTQCSAYTHNTSTFLAFALGSVMVSLIPFKCVQFRWSWAHSIRRI